MKANLPFIFLIKGGKRGEGGDNMGHIVCSSELQLKVNCRLKKKFSPGCWQAMAEHGNYLTCYHNIF